jgi:hypothetical protein
MYLFNFSALISFTNFTDYGSYFSLPLPFSVYLGVAIAALGILLCVFIGAVRCVRRYATLHSEDYNSLQ